MEKINVDTTYILGNNGISRDAKNILRQLQIKNEITEVRFLNMTLNENRLLRRILNLFNLLLNLHIPIGKKYYGVFYQPHLSPFCPGKNTTGWVIRIHDLFPIMNPEWFRWWATLIFKRNLKFAISHGANFLFNSNYTQDVFLNLFPECQGRVALAPCSTSSLNETLCQNCHGCIEILQNPKQESTLLAVGTIEPRKNYESLIHFWKLNGADIPGIERLVIIGSPGWKSKSTQNELSHLKELNIIWLQSCCDGSLSYFYKNSKCFVSTSIDEGFNLPALEARLNYSLPLFLSDISIHHEIHGEKAKYFKNSEDLLLLLLSDPNMSKNNLGVEDVLDTSALNSFFKNLNSF